MAERVPSIDLLRFGNSGTECVQYALRFARASTGRRLIVRFEGHYHGWSDAIHFSAHPDLASAGPADHPNAVPGSTGMAGVVADSLLILPWNDRDAVDRAFAEHGDEIAAVITEPIMGNGGGMPPAPGYLEHLRERTRAAGSLLIFDEVLTGLPRRTSVRAGPATASSPTSPSSPRPSAAASPSRRSAAAAPRWRRQRGPHDARRHLQLEPDRVRRGDRDDGGDGPRRLLRGARRPRAQARRGARRGRARRPTSRPAGAARARSSSSGSPAEAPTDYRAAIAIVEQSPFPTFQREMLDRGILIQPPQEGLFLISAAHTDEDVEHHAAARRRGDAGRRARRLRGPRRAAGRGAMRARLGLLAVAALRRGAGALASTGGAATTARPAAAR